VRIEVIIDFDAASSITRLSADIRSGKKAVRVDGALRYLSLMVKELNTAKIEIG
jgi:hypothetical protein